MPEIVLRPYQRKAIDDIRAAFRAGHRRVLLVMPTASGKTACVQKIARGVQHKGDRAWFIEHRRELIQQSAASFMNAGIPHSIISGGRVGNMYAGIQIASVQTIVGRLDRLPKPHIIMPDEAHHCAASTWREVMTYHDVKQVGLTATPCRLDGQPLGEFFDHMVVGPSIRDLIDMVREDGLAGGYLADYRLFIAPDVQNTDDIKPIGGDLPAQRTYQHVKGRKRTGNMIQHYGDLCNGTKAILSAYTIEDSIELAAAFRESGIAAEHIDGTMSDSDRRRVFDGFEIGPTKVLTQVDILGEGLHVSGVGCVIHGRRTFSLSRYMQFNGRGFAPKPDGSSLIILDHAGNSGAIVNGEWQPNHGFPDDPREWSLTGTMRRPQAGDPAIAIRQCAKCGATVRASVRRCPDPCGYDFPVMAAPIKQAAGTLVEIDTRTARERKADEKSAAAAEKARAKAEREEQKRLQAQVDEEKSRHRKAEEMACGSERELAELGRSRQYKNPEFWAAKKWPIIEKGRASRAAADMRRRNG